MCIAALPRPPQPAVRAGHRRVFGLLLQMSWEQSRVCRRGAVCVTALHMSAPLSLPALSTRSAPGLPGSCWTPAQTPPDFPADCLRLLRGQAAGDCAQRCPLAGDDFPGVAPPPSSESTKFWGVFFWSFFPLLQRSQRQWDSWKKAVVN